MTAGPVVSAEGGRHRQLTGAVATGLLLTAAFPAVGAGPLAAVALVPLMVTLNGGAPREAARYGWISGLVHYLTFLFWVVFTMHTYGGMAYYQSVPVLVLLAAYLAVYPAVLAAIWSWVAPSPKWALAVMPVSWMVAEWLRAHLVTGFPWGLLAYGLADFPILIQPADAIGVYGVSGLLVLVNTAVALGWCAHRGRQWFGWPVIRGQIIASGVLVVVVAMATVGYGLWRMDRLEKVMATAPRVSVAVAQGNIDQAVKWDPSFQIDTLDRYREISFQARNRADLVVWPETATPFYYGYNELLSGEVDDIIRATGAWFMVGSPSVRQGSDRLEYYNTAYLLDPSATVKGRYDKVHLVPFGEYVPLRRFLGFAGKIVAQVGDFDAGQPGAVLAWPKGRIGTLICYEVIFPELSRAMVANGADLLVTITNDAWFGRTGAAEQHFAMAVFRAVETHRAVARSANTGISGFIDPAGRVTSATGLFEPALRIQSLPRLTRHTLYVQWGDWWLAVMLALVIGGLVYHRRRSSP